MRGAEKSVVAMARRATMEIKRSSDFMPEMLLGIGGFFQGGWRRENWVSGLV